MPEAHRCPAGRAIFVAVNYARISLVAKGGENPPLAFSLDALGATSSPTFPPAKNCQMVIATEEGATSCFRCGGLHAHFSGGESGNSPPLVDARGATLFPNFSAKNSQTEIAAEQWRPAAFFLVGERWGSRRFHLCLGAFGASIHRSFPLRSAKSNRCWREECSEQVVIARAVVVTVCSSFCWGRDPFPAVFIRFGCTRCDW